MVEQLDTSCEISGIRGIKEFAKSDDELMDKIISSRLTVVGYELPGARRILDLIVGSGQPISVVITFKDELSLEEYKRSQAYCSNIELFSYTASPFNFSRSVEKLFKYKSRRDGNSDKYMQVKIEHCLLFEEACADIFLCLGNHKYIKIFRRFDSYTLGDVKKYMNKGTEFFYVKSNDYNTFIQQVLRLKFGQAEFLLSQNSDSALVPTKCHEAVFEMINSIGLDENCVKITGQALNKTMELIEKSSLTSLLAELLQKNSYISEHSMMVSFLAGGICRHTDWYSHENLMRLTMASFFHDLKCSDEVVAKVSVINNTVLKELDLTQQTMLHAHIQDGLDLVLQIGGIPTGVDKILLAHHEKYDGSGFPHELDYKQLEPLSAIFIIAHELVDIFYEVGFYRDNIFVVLQDMKNTYSGGHFPRVVEGLIMALSAQTYFEDKNGSSNRN